MGRGPSGPPPPAAAAACSVGECLSATLPHTLAFFYFLVHRSLPLSKTLRFAFTSRHPEEFRGWVYWILSHQFSVISTVPPSPADTQMLKI